MTRHLTSAIDTPRLASRGFGLDLGAMFDKVVLWLEIRRERRQLMGLDDHLLKDIGLTRADVHRETHGRFWDIPTNRR